MTVDALGPSALRWLFLDFNSYFASVEQQENPALRGRPVVVTPAATDATSAIAASIEAKAHGIRTGTRIYEARRLCPGLVVRLANHGLYVDYHHRLKAEIERHIPITEVCSVDEVACALMGRERAPDRATAIARAIKAGIRANVGVALGCSIGIASSKLLAKVASDMEKPDGLTILDPAELPGRLLSLELRDIPGIGHNMERRLNTAGITSMAALWALPPKQLRQIWGSVTGERFWYGLHGYDLPVDAAGPTRSISHGHVMPPSLRGAEDARQMARHLTVKTASRLRRHGFEAGMLGLWVRLDPPRAARGWGERGFAGERGRGEGWGDALRFPRTDDSLLLLRQLDRLWARLAAGLQDGLQGRAVRKIDVTLSDFAPKGATAPDLFAWADSGAGSGADSGGSRGLAGRQGRRPDTGALFAAVDRLNRQFGKDMVRVGALPDGQRQAHEAVVGTKIAFTRIPEPEPLRSLPVQSSPRSSPVSGRGWPGGGRTGSTSGP